MTIELPKSVIRSDRLLQKFFQSMSDACSKVGFVGAPTGFIGPGWARIWILQRPDSSDSRGPESWVQEHAATIIRRLISAWLPSIQEDMGEHESADVPLWLVVLAYFTLGRLENILESCESGDPVKLGQDRIVAPSLMK